MKSGLIFLFPLLTSKSLSYLLRVSEDTQQFCFLDLPVFPPVLHAILILVQATTLNVAFNSHNKSLLTIMMSNNVSKPFISIYLSQGVTWHSGQDNIIFFFYVISFPGQCVIFWGTVIMMEIFLFPLSVC